MRNGLMLVGLGIIFVAAGAGRAEPVPYTITATEVLVRSGPSPEFYATGKLHRGEKVLVQREDTTGWLAIVPPPGSFSWINAHFIERIGSNQALVKTANAPIRVGSRLVNQEPTVERFHVVAGTQVVIIGKPEVARDGSWLPIRPVPSEARFIPAEAVRPTPALPVFAAASPESVKPSPTQAGSTLPRPPISTAPVGSPPGSPIASSSTPAPANPSSPLWLEAEEAERRGNLVQAQALFEQLAEQVKSTDHELWVRCLNRLKALQERRNQGVPGQRPTSLVMNAHGSTGLTAGRSVPSPANPAAPSQVPGASSEYCYLRDSGYTAHLTEPVLNVPTPPAAPTGQWYEPGRLWRTAFSVDGKQAYRYEPAAGNSRRWIYVTAANSVNLEPYVGKTVSLYGPMTYRGDLRTYYLAVLQVTPVNSVR